MKPAIHPDEVLKALTTASSRSQKIKNLESLHALCAAQHQGSKDFSLSIIGKLWEATGGIMSRALYNAASQDYRTLIEAWEKHSGPSKPKQAANASDSKNPAYLARIDDPAIRSLVQAALIERDKLRAEVNLLKSFSALKIDMSPKALPQTAPASLPGSEPEKTSFTASEVEALDAAISKKHMESEGWQEGQHGEILNERGRRIFEAGFTHAIRKAVNLSKHTRK